MKKLMMFCLLVGVVTSAQAQPATITKTMSAATAELGEILTVELTVENPYLSEVTVEDVLPDGLSYIVGSLTVDGAPTPATVVGNTVSVGVGADATHAVEFTVQVTEVQYEPVDVTNIANVYDPEGGLDGTDDSVVVTLEPYEGFTKSAEIVYEEGGELDGVVEVGELVQWNMTITLANSFAWGIVGAAISDNLGGELGLAGDEVDNDQDGDVDDGDPGDLAAGSNSIPVGTLAIETKGRSNKVQLDITDVDVGVAGSVDFVLAVFTDKNPGKKKKTPPGTQEYTSRGTYELNSGAVVKFIHPDTSLQLSAHTAPIPVTVEGEDPD
jgi:uncharacterized repeat protein (TIGR01451 family)